MEQITLPIQAESLLPHKRPMSLLRNVVTFDSESIVCDVEIGPETLFLEEDHVPTWVALEYMAQAVAAYAGFVARREGEEPQIGFLLGSRDVKFFINKFSMGQILHIRAQHIWGEGELFSFDCSVCDAKDGQQLATAQLNVLRPKDVSRYFKGEPK